LDYFCPSALQATARKRERYFVDLFAGPGINVERDLARHEFEGSPLRVLQYCAPQNDRIAFTHAVFVNNVTSVRDALERRISRAYESRHPKIPRNNIRNIFGDSNKIMADILAAVPHLAYAFVFADIEAPNQLPWQTVAALRAQGHRSIDLYVLFPLDMALQRLMSYTDGARPRYATQLNRFFGTDEWRKVASARVSNAQAGDLRRGLVELYLAQLRRHWSTAGEVMDVHLRGRQRLYKMLFATDHPAGVRIADWITTKTLRDQRDLFS